MDRFTDPNDVAVAAHHSEHHDLGTITPELMILVWVAVKAAIRAAVKAVEAFIDYGWSICSWPNAPPVRAA